jgi:hypothetical protein
MAGNFAMPTFGGNPPRNVLQPSMPMPQQGANPPGNVMSRPTMPTPVANPIRGRMPITRRPGFGANPPRNVLGRGTRKPGMVPLSGLRAL